MKTTERGGPRGSDSGKRIQGRKRHLVVDTLGLLLAVVVHSAGLQDRDGIKLVWEKLQGRFSRLKLIWADGAYAAVVGWAKAVCGGVLELVRKPEGLRTFQVLPHRWVAETRRLASLRKTTALASAKLSAAPAMQTSSQAPGIKARGASPRISSQGTVPVPQCRQW